MHSQRTVRQHALRIAHLSGPLLVSNLATAGMMFLGGDTAPGLWAWRWTPDGWEDQHLEASEAEQDLAPVLPVRDAGDWFATSTGPVPLWLWYDTTGDIRADAPAGMGGDYARLSGTDVGSSGEQHGGTGALSPVRVRTSGRAAEVLRECRRRDRDVVQRSCAARVPRSSP